MMDKKVREYEFRYSKRLGLAMLLFSVPAVVIAIIYEIFSHAIVVIIMSMGVEDFFRAQDIRSLSFIVIMLILWNAAYTVGEATGQGVLHEKHVEIIFDDKKHVIPYRKIKSVFLEAGDAALH